MDVVMGAVAAVCWGATDFLVGVNGRRVGIQSSVFYAQLIGFIVLVTIWLAVPTQRPVTALITPAIWGMAITAAGLVTLGSLCLSRAFATGKTAIVAPLVTAYGAVTVLLDWVTGASLAALTVLGLALCLVGVTISAISPPDHRSRPGAKQASGFALAAALLYGISFWLQGRYVLPVVGATAVLMIGYATGLSVLALGFLRIRRLPVLPTAAQALLLIMASVLNLGGFVSFALGVNQGSVSVVTMLSTLSAAVAAILGACLLKERLSGRQWGGVVLAICGALVLHR